MTISVSITFKSAVYTTTSGVDASGGGTGKRRYTELYALKIPWDLDLRGVEYRRDWVFTVWM